MCGSQNKDLVVDVRALTVGYEKGTPVLERLTAQFYAGALVLVSGRNGAGKSTLLEACSGYLAPWAGSVTVRGHDARSPQARSFRRVCRTQLALYPNMTVRDHLAFAARCVGDDLREVLGRAERYGLGQWLDYDAKALSTGNSRKLWVILCTLGSFDAVILDEPFNGLDDDSGDMLCEDIQKWATEKAVLLIAHSCPPDLVPDRTLVLGPPVQR